MSLKLENLNDEGIRKLMLNEVEKDINTEKIYFSPRLKDNCKKLYLDLLKKSIQDGNDDSLANDILRENCLKSTMPRRTSSGKTIMAKVPINAHTTLAEGEFNRFYLRAACLKAITEDKDIEVYRAKNVTLKRPKSETMIGEILDANKLLNDLQTNIGTNPSQGLPGGPNSGLSGKIN